LVIEPRNTASDTRLALKNEMTLPSWPSLTQHTASAAVATSGAVSPLWAITMTVRPARRAA